MKKQASDTLLMIRPSRFRKNEDTAVNNFFQSAEDTQSDTQARALAEFDTFAALLQNAGVRTIVLDDAGDYDTPDSLFPNNVISFHGDRAVLYPMFAPNRREERKLNVLEQLRSKGLAFEHIVDYSAYEAQHQYLEGTGVLVLDRLHSIAYCCLSARADSRVLKRFCEDFAYTAVTFEAFQHHQGQTVPIYHTNVMMSVGTTYAVVCLDSVTDFRQRENLRRSLQATNREIIEITEAQMHHFCGNILEVNRQQGGALIVMSEQAYQHFSEEQRLRLAAHGTIVYAPLYTIEKYGGGGARCMIAEIFS